MNDIEIEFVKYTAHERNAGQVGMFMRTKHERKQIGVFYNFHGKKLLNVHYTLYNGKLIDRFYCGPYDMYISKDYCENCEMPLEKEKIIERTHNWIHNSHVFMQREKYTVRTPNFSKK